MPVVLFFYKKECTKCDDQSFVMGDINRKIDDEISIFSFDTDLNLTTVNLLNEFYGIDQYPCLIIEDKKMCGMQDKDVIINTICEYTNISLCS